jgi:L-ascorbate metabolism protein UlaG (beta-lactamase superfamily)
MWNAAVRTLLWSVFLLSPGVPAWAAGCFPVAGLEPRLVPVSLETAALPGGATVRLTFLGHASFLIESAQGASAVTDYNGYLRPPYPPDVATMNNAHGTHYTEAPDPKIPYVLRGWNPAGGEARHDVTVKDMRVRNIPTAVHGRAGRQTNSNSIFVFEVGDLCIAHLGHLHQAITDQILAELGQIDVVLVPIDGTYTMAQEEMVEAIRRIGAPVVIPMHYFGPSVLARFLGLVEGEYVVDARAEPELLLARTTLPARRTVVVLPGS